MSNPQFNLKSITVNLDGLLGLGKLAGDQCPGPSFFEICVKRQAKRMNSQQLYEEMQYWVWIERFDVAIVLLKLLKESLERDRAREQQPTFPAGGYYSKTRNNSPFDPEKPIMPKHLSAPAFYHNGKPLNIAGLADLLDKAL